jgi:hypothetical protein
MNNDPDHLNHASFCRDTAVWNSTWEVNMSWKVEVIIDDSGEWEGDAFRFATEQEALAYARDLEFRCSAVRDKRITKSLDPVNQLTAARGARAAGFTRSGS